MNTYDRFLSSLLSEFKRKAQPEIRSLWADLMELAEARDERALSTACQQALRRTQILGRAAGAANAQEVRSQTHALEVRLGVLTQARAAARPELFEGLYASQRQLAETLYSIDVEAPDPENTRQPTETLLVESCAN